MCGIVGQYNTGLSIEPALEALRHRGPDACGIVEEGVITHGHARLSIIDPEPRSDQPFRFRDSILAFNGEIWNFRDLRKDLEALGYQFTTSGDTEVLATALYEWGAGALERIDGMFAFSWTKGDQHILARDRFGKVPLYVRKKGNGILWASERKAFLALGIKRSDEFPAGCWYDAKKGTLIRYYDIGADRKDKDLARMLRESVEKRLIADVPLCCLVSGGLDSSLILAFAKLLKSDIVAYTAEFDGESEDLKSAIRLCRELKVPLHRVKVSVDAEKLSHAICTIETSMKAQVEIAALCIPLAEQISKDGFKVCLSGEGADEIFGGYGNMAIQASKADDGGWFDIRKQQIQKMARGNFIRCNKAFMAHGVECRLPYMDRDIVEHALSMGKRECPPGKKMLKEAAWGIIPGWVINRPKATFQGGSGMAKAISNMIDNPVRFYNAEYRKFFG